MSSDSILSSDMPGTPQNVEIAYVLFMDIVGYSKRHTDVQNRLAEELKRLVLNTEEMRSIIDPRDLVRRPTGDGMALIFFRDVLSPLRCAVQIAEAFKRRAAAPLPLELRMELRMGIHSGPVYRTKNINNEDDVAGDGINMAQRVMDCGDDGHILLSQEYAENIVGINQLWRYTERFGLCTVKNGVQVSLVNFYIKEQRLGNPDRPLKQKKEIAARIEQDRVMPLHRPSRPDKTQSVKNSLAILIWGLSMMILIFGAFWLFSPSFREWWRITMEDIIHPRTQSPGPKPSKGGSRKDTDALPPQAPSPTGSNVNSDGTGPFTPPDKRGGPGTHQTGNPNPPKPPSPGPVKKPQVKIEFTANDAYKVAEGVYRVAPGTKIVLVWDTTNVTDVSIDPDIGPVQPSSSSDEITITEPTTFTLTGTDKEGHTVTKTVTITVADAPEKSNSGTSSDKDNPSSDGKTPSNGNPPSKEPGSE